MRKVWAVLVGGLFLVACSDSDGPATPPETGRTETAATAAISPLPTRTQDEALMDAVSKWTPTVSAAAGSVSTVFQPAKAGDTQLIVRGAPEFVVGAKFLLHPETPTAETIEVDGVGFEVRGGSGLNILSLRIPLLYPHGIGEAVSAEPGNAGASAMERRQIKELGGRVLVTAGAGIASSTVEDIRDGLAVMDAYAREVLGVEPAGPLSVVAGVQCDGGISFAGYFQGTVCFNFSHADWGRNLPHVGKVASHEYFHSVQVEVGCGENSDIAPAPDRWLQEGAAEQFAWMAHAWAGRITPSAVRQILQGSRAQSRAVDLREFELGGKPDQGLPYGASSAAFSLLVGDHPEAWTAYCKARGQGVEWRTAFQSAFGLDTDEFYAKFARWAAE